jgi:hypothetical protein
MKVLFVCYGGGHVTMVLPVIQRLREQVPDVEVTLIALTTAYRAAISAGEPALRFLDLKHLTDPEFVDEWGGRLLQGNSHPAVSVEETAAYIGVNIWDLAQQHGLDKALALYQEQGRYGFYPIRFFDRVLEHLRPDVVVATNSPRSEHAALEAAMDRRIPTLSMIDLFAMSFDPYLKRKRHADCISTMLPQVGENLVAAGIPPSRIVVTGNPAFDGLFDPRQRGAAIDLRRVLGWEHLKVVLWAGIVEREPSGLENIPAGTAFGETVERMLRSWCARRHDVALIVRYHPNEAHLFSSLGDQPRVYVSRPFEDPLHPQILAADAVVVTGSTVGVETAAAGVPVLSLESSGSSGWMSYAKLGISQGVDRLADLESTLDQALFQPQTAATALQPGPAGPRVAEEIRRLASRPR